MAILEFPINPIVGQTYMAPGGKVWRYGGEAWICLVDSGTQIYYNTTPPDDVAKYPLWVNTDTGDLMVFYQDVDSDQWIKIGTTGGGSGTGGGGGATTLGDLTDVDTTGALDTYILEFDGTNWVAVANAGGGASVAMDDLTDADTTTSPPATNDYLRWVAPNWVPYTLVTTNWDTAYTHSQSLHAPTDADNTSTNETSHSDVVQDGDFTVNGLMIRSGAGVYVTTPDNHLNWDTAYTHSQATHAPADADNTSANETSHSDVVVDGDFGSNGSMERIALGTYITILHKRDATTAPLVTDDSGAGYSIGSRWIDVTNNKEYVAVDVSVGAAVWKETTSTGGGSITVEDEGTPLTTAVTKFNFVGTNVTVTEPVADEMLVTISGGAGVTELDDLTDVDTTTTSPVTDDILEFDGTNWVPVTNAGGGSSTFVGLTDSPSTYNAGDAGKTVVVNQTEDGVEFGTQGNVVYQDEVSFGATRLTDQTILVTDATTLIFDDIIFNNGNGYDDTTGIFTAPVDGSYQFNVSFRADNLDTNGFQFEFVGTGQHNVRNQQYKTNVGINYEPFNNSVIFEMVAGETAYVLVKSVADTNYHIDYRCSFTGHLISPAVTVAPNGITHAFSVNTSGGSQTNITNSTWIPIEWATISYQKNVSFDLANNKFVIPSDGLWHFDITVAVSEVPPAPSLEIYISISVNGSQDKRIEFKRSDGVESTYRMSGSMDLDLVSGDEIEVEINHTDTTDALDIPASEFNTTFSGHKVSGTSTGVEYDSYDIACKTKLSSNQTLIVANTYTKINLDDVVYDTGGNWDTVNDRFVVPVDGLYKVYVSGWAVNVSAIEVFMNVFVNGVRRAQVDRNSKTVNSAGRNETFSGYLEIELLAGDYVEMYSRSSITSMYFFGDTSATEYTYMSISLSKTPTKAESSFHATKGGADQTGVTSNANVFVTWPNTEFNYGNNFSTITGKFTAPEDGRYSFSTATTFESIAADKQIIIKLRLNGSSIRQTESPTTSIASRTSVTVNAITEMVKGDEMSVVVYQNDTASETIVGSTNVTYFSGYRLVSSQDTPKETKELSDVSTLPATTNDLLMHNGTEYVPTQVLNNEVSFDVTLSGDSATFADSATHVVDYDTVIFENNCTFDTVNHRFYAPVAGRYDVSSTFHISSMTTGADINCQINHSNDGGGIRSIRFLQDRNAISVEGVSGSGVFDMAEGDFLNVTVQIYSTGSANFIRGDSQVYNSFSGHLVSPAVVLAPNGITHAFFVQGTNGLSLPTTTTTQIEFDTVIYEENLSFDLTNNQFVAPSAGIYHFECRVTITSIADQQRPYANFTVVTGGVTKTIYVQDFNQSGTGLARLGGTIQYKLNAGDTVDFRIYNPTTATTVRQTTNIETFFTGHKVSGTSTGVEYDDYDIFFDVYQSTTQSALSNSTYHKVNLDTVITNKGDNFDTTNYKFIAPVDGLYQFDGWVRWGLAPDQTRLIARIYKNGNSDIFGDLYVSSAAATNAIADVSGTMNLVAGDEIELYSYQVSGGTLDMLFGATNTATRFSGRLVKSLTKAECSFNANLSTPQVLTIASASIITLDSTQFDYGNNFDTINNRFVAPEDGRYVLSFAATATTISVATSDFLAYIRANGTTTLAHGSRGAPSTNPYVTSAGSVIIELTKDDYVELLVYQTESTSETISDNNYRTFFSGYRLISSQDIAATAIGDLSDVDTTTTPPILNDGLVWDGAKWVPQVVSGGVTFRQSFLLMGA